MDPEVLKGTQDKFSSVLKTEIGMQKDNTKDKQKAVTDEKTVEKVNTIEEKTIHSKNIRKQKRATKNDDEEQSSDAIMSPANPSEDEVPK